MRIYRATAYERDPKRCSNTKFALFYENNKIQTDVHHTI